MIGKSQLLRWAVRVRRFIEIDMLTWGRANGERANAVGDKESTCRSSNIQMRATGAGCFRKLASGALSLDVFVKDDSVSVAAIVVAAILALLLEETSSAAHKVQ